MPFSKGDPNIWRGGRQRREIINGQTIAEIAQEHTLDSVKLLAAVQAGLDEHGEPKDYPVNQRIRCAELLLNYGHGKPVDTLKLEQQGRLISGESLEAIPTNRLEAMLELPSNDLEPIDKH